MAINDLENHFQNNRPNNLPNEFQDWAQKQWGHAKLGDKRRNQRAVRLGGALAAQPDASLPAQTGQWSELKAAYRLLAEPDVTHEALTQPHRQSIQQQASMQDGVVLFVQDTTALDYTRHEQTQGLGHIGNGKGAGLMVHSCLAVVPNAPVQGVDKPGVDKPGVDKPGVDKPGVDKPGADKPGAELLGLAAQMVWVREPNSHAGETRHERNQRRTEADVWAETVEKIGAAPVLSAPEKTASSCLWVSVGDRGSDLFSYVQRIRRLGWHCLIRVCQDRVIQRVIQKEHSQERERLLTCLRSLPSMTSQQITLRGRDGMPQREVKLQIAWQGASVCAPRSRELSGQEPIVGWYVRCWEEPNTEEPNTEEPKSKDALEWLLFTTISIEDAASAHQVLSWYEQRWLIEEYHKCLKTGCSVERRQLRSSGSLQALLGFLSIVGLRLLQMRTLSRQFPAAPAVSSVPPSWLALLVARRGLGSSSVASLTVSEFWRHVAGLGGFLGRKSDGDPGWQTLWRGWFRFQDMVWAASWAQSGH